jgi:hypothetical protein
MNITVLKMVVAIVGLVEVVVLIGMVFLVVGGRNIPGTFETVAVAGLTGLLGLLAPSQAVAQN